LRKNKESKQQEESKDQNALNFVKKQKQFLNIDNKSSKRVRRNPNAAEEISTAVGFNRLSESEKDLVIKINMMPEKFNQVKNLLIKENEKNQAVKESFIGEINEKAGSEVNPQQIIGKYWL